MAPPVKTTATRAIDRSVAVGRVRRTGTLPGVRLRRHGDGRDRPRGGRGRRGGGGGGAGPVADTTVPPACPEPRALQVGRSAPRAAAIGSTAFGSAAGCDSV